MLSKLYIFKSYNKFLMKIDNTNFIPKLFAENTNQDYILT